MLLKQFKRIIDRSQLLEKGDRMVVGVSAGVDSMVLLYLLNTCRPTFDLSLIVAHVNHGLRPTESAKEAELVQLESERLGLPFEYGQFDVKTFHKVRGISLQDAARRIRFHFFGDVLQKHGANKIALGHNADDQVETVLLKLMRGSGLRGLKGMLPIREGRVIRPLLEVWRREIELFADQMGIPYRVDASNLKVNYLRNRLRLVLIPLIEREFQPDFKTRVIRAVNILREEDHYLEKGAEEAYQKITRQERDTFSFKFSEYQCLHRAIRWRVVRKILERINRQGMILEEGEWMDVDSIYKRLEHPHSSFSLELSHGICCEKRYDRVLLRKGRVKTNAPFEVELLTPGLTFVEEIGRNVVIEEIIKEDRFEGLSGLPNTASLDYQRLEFPLRMRNFRPGDRFQPLGLKGTQKLKEFFIDRKIPKFERPEIPLLISGDIIAWVVGYRIDERVKVTEETKRIMKIKVI